ncbi:MAG: ankyrin repeat domain-containing protein [Armatimonadota bacterium]
MRKPLSVLRCMTLIAATAVVVLFFGPAPTALGQDKDPFIVPTPQPIAGRPELCVLPAGRASARVALFSPDSKRLAVGGTGGVFVWDLTTGQPVARLAGHEGEITALAFSPDGARLASGGADRAVMVWSLADGRAQLTLTRHAGRINALAFSPDGTRLASASDDKTVIQWNAATGIAAKTLTAHADAVAALAFSPDGKWLATGGLDRNILLWNPAADGEPRRLPEQKDAVAALAFSPDGQTLAAAAGAFTPADRRFGQCEVTLWKTESGEVLKKLPPVGADLLALAFTADGTGVVTATGNRTLAIWNVERAREHQVAVGMAASPDLTRSATWERDGRLTLWELKARRALLRCIGMDDGGWLSATPEGYYAASKDGDARAGWRFGAATYTGDCFAEKFNKPELLRRALAGEDLSREPVLDGARQLPPNLAFVTPMGDQEIEKRTVELKLQAAGLHPIARIELTVNGKPCPPDMAKAMTFTTAEKQQQTVSLGYRLPLNETRFRLRAVAYDAEGLRSAPAEVTLYLPGAREAAERLFVLCVGVDRFKAPEIPALHFTEADADAIGKLFTEKKIQPPCSQGFKVKTLLGEAATLSAITAALNEIKTGAGPNDMVIIYLAGRRMRDAGGNLFLLPYDANPANLRGTCVDWRTLAAMVNNTTARQVLVLADIGRSTAHPMVKTLDAQLRAFYAIKPDQTGAEQGSWEHGAFAAAIIEGLGGKADAGKVDGVVTFSELNDYVTKRVVELSEGRQTPEWPGLDEKLKDIPLTWAALPRLDTMTADELTKRLQTDGAGASQRDNTGRTLLHWAAAANRADLVSLLLELGADVNAADATGVTALHIASAAGLHDVAGKLLARGANLHAQDNETFTAFDIARIYDQGAMMDFYLPAALPDSRDGAGNTPLHLAVLYNRPKVVQQMLAKKVDLAAVDNNGNTPLHLAAVKGAVEIAGLLLAKDASINAVNTAGNTPLHLAAAANQTKVAALLLDRGAKIDPPDQDGRSPLFATIDGEYTAMIDLLAKRGARLDLGDKEGVTALHLAVLGGKFKAARQLLARGADANVRDTAGKLTPLHLAAVMESPEMLKLLLEFKPGLTPHDKDGHTPLHAAAWYNRVQNITLLLTAGAPLNEKNKGGLTPLAMANKNNAADAAKLLKAKGGFE